MTEPPDSTLEQYAFVRSVRRVLFLSAHNAARSLIAEAWLRHLGGDQFEVESAGDQPAPAAHPMALAVVAATSGL
jgi:protein-tyrosine-phosphatase